MLRAGTSDSYVEIFEKTRYMKYLYLEIIHFWVMEKKKQRKIHFYTRDLFEIILLGIEVLISVNFFTQNAVFCIPKMLVVISTQCWVKWTIPTAWCKLDYTGLFHPKFATTHHRLFKTPKVVFVQTYHGLKTPQFFYFLIKVDILTKQNTFSLVCLVFIKSIPILVDE